MLGMKGGQTVLDGLTSFHAVLDYFCFFGGNEEKVWKVLLESDLIVRRPGFLDLFWI